MNNIMAIFKNTLTHTGSMLIVLIMPAIVEIMKADTNVLSYVASIFPMFVGVSVFRFVREIRMNNEPMQ